MSEIAQRVACRFIEKVAKEEPYGEVYRKREDRVTVVVRKIFQARKGDSYHVRVLKGEGKASDEKTRGEVLFQTDEKSEKDAIKAAEDWMRSPKGEKALAKLE